MVLARGGRNGRAAPGVWKTPRAWPPEKVAGLDEGPLEEGTGGGATDKGDEECVERGRRGRGRGEREEEGTAYKIEAGRRNL